MAKSTTKKPEAPAKAVPKPSKGKTRRSKTKKAPTLAKRPAQPEIKSTAAFYEDDFPKTLFPLRTNLELIRHGEAEIKSFITDCLDDSKKQTAFMQQRRTYANKPGLHLRRTFKLDVVAEYYLYDLVFRNRKLFRKSHTDTRTHYGYRFTASAPIPATSAYKGFRGAIADYRDDYSCSLSLDVASYFNSLYHHDLVNWFAELGAPADDVEGFGQLLRQITSGRSLDCLPQGIYPAKMIGNDFLRFIDDNFQLRSEQLVRFMDDIYLFSDDEQKLRDDFITVQRLLGDKGLSVNPKKTAWNDAAHVDVAKQIDTAKKNLLKKRRILITVGYDEEGDEEVEESFLKTPLTDSELEYIGVILEKDELEEEDAELILTIMRDNTSRVEKHLPLILERFPNLTKSVWSFCRHMSKKDFIADVLLALLGNGSRLTEFQLFWLGYIAEDYLLSTDRASAVLQALFMHPSATPISKSKILEIPDSRFGLNDLRIENLSTGASDWLAWSSAVGLRTMKPASRNQALKYFANASLMNGLISGVVLKMPQP